ncbi:CE1 family esterase [Flavitalea antarctica]
MSKCLLYIPLFLFHFTSLKAQFLTDSILIEGRYRSFHYNKPANPQPGGSLLFLMHGSGGSGSDMAKSSTKLQAKSAEEKLLIVYPDGYQHFWNECRRYSTARANQEDVNEQAFFQAMINYFDSLYQVDKNKVFAAGMSGGGHMAYKLGLTMPGQIQAIAAIIANLPDSASMDCVPSGKALPVMIVNGTLDEVNPYNGGEMFVNKSSFGVVQSTEKSFEYWARLAGYTGKPVKKLLPDVDPEDKKRIESYTFKSPNKPEVTLLKVIGGHHDYPNDIDVFLYIWNFFKRSATNTRPQANASGA